MLKYAILGYIMTAFLQIDGYCLLCHGN